MRGRSLILGIFLVIMLCISTEGRKRRKRARLRGLMMADDPEPVVTAVEPKTEIGQCTCTCCDKEVAPRKDPPCANDVIVAVDGSACFRDHHNRMKQFLNKLVSEFHKSGSETQFGINKTRLGVLQFSSDIVNAISLDGHDVPRESPSKRIRADIAEQVQELGFLGEGAFLNKALNATAREFFSRPRPADIVQGIEEQEGQIRKVVIVLTNGKSHPDVTESDLDQSLQYLRDNDIIVLPVSVTRRCYGVSSADWDEGLCPDEAAMRKLSELSTLEEDYLPMRSSGTAKSIVNKAITCAFNDQPEELNAEDLCRNCTCDCDLPIGPKGDPGRRGPKGDSIEGPEGEAGPKGDKGDLGPKGSQGEFGATGEKGEVGPVGPKGEVGPVGPPGDQGVEGPEGEKGDTGRKGEQGVKGEIGEDGVIGEKGDTGGKGDIGSEGPKGSKGEVGERGIEGPKGDPGRDGLSFKGDRGERGTKGSKGEDGIEGPPGDKGMKGVQGLCGKPGPPGPQGEPGLAGVDGQDGMTGQPGLQGPRGREGIAGDKGERGNSGIDGVMGPIGPEGRPGPPGPPGEPGQRGFDGRDSEVAGPEGLQGPKGDRGLAGPEGLGGTQGYPGERGPRGYTGPKGDEGRVDAATLRPIIAEIIRELLPGECASPTPTRNITDEECHEVPIDLVFLIDGSDSIERDEFVEVERWIQTMVDRFNPSAREEDIHLDVVQYSSTVENSVHAFIKDSSEEVRARLEGINQLREGSKAYLGLEFVNREVTRRLRERAHKILITTSDGDPSDKDERNQAEIDAVRAFFDTMIVVGVGEDFKDENMVDFTDPNKPSIVKVNDFSVLDANIDNIVEKSCNEIVRATEEAVEESRRRKRHVADQPRRRNHKKRSAHPKPFLIQE